VRAKIVKYWSFRKLIKKFMEEQQMNKSELITAVSEKSGLSKKDGEAAINATIDSITAGLQNGEKVQLVGFGVFEVKERAARTGRNPKTKEEIQIPASRAPVFKAGKAFKDAIG